MAARELKMIHATLSLQMTKQAKDMAYLPKASESDVGRAEMQTVTPDPEARASFCERRAPCPRQHREDTRGPAADVTGGLRPARSAAAAQEATVYASRACHRPEHHAHRPPAHTRQHSARPHGGATRRHRALSVTFKTGRPQQPPAGGSTHKPWCVHGGR